jgi:hypothetical protein
MVRLGKIRRLIINLPPRSLKSLITSVAFPAFVLGHDPTKRIIAVSYGSDLAIKFSNDCRVILNAQWFRELFPATKISKTKSTEYEVVTTRRGYRLAASIDGSVTGRGADILVVDDPSSTHFRTASANGAMTFLNIHCCRASTTKRPAPSSS